MGSQGSAWDLTTESPCAPRAKRHRGSAPGAGARSVVRLFAQDAALARGLPRFSLAGTVGTVGSGDAGSASVALPSPVSERGERSPGIRGLERED